MANQSSSGEGRSIPLPVIIGVIAVLVLFVAIIAYRSLAGSGPQETSDVTQMPVKDRLRYMMEVQAKRREEQRAKFGAGQGQDAGGGAGGGADNGAGQSGPGAGGAQPGGADAGGAQSR
jgi:hypothetical protein